jgi:Leucine-rich repeat (LRR) protein
VFVPFIHMDNVEEITNDLSDDVVHEILRKGNFVSRMVRERCTTAKWIDSDSTDVEAALALLGRCPALRFVNLSGSKVINIESLAALTNLRSLDLSCTPVVNIKPFAALTNLQSLNLSDTLVADIKPLLVLTKLQHIDLRLTLVNRCESWYFYLNMLCTCNGPCPCSRPCMLDNSFCLAI